MPGLFDIYDENPERKHRKRRREEETGVVEAVEPTETAPPLPPTWLSLTNALALVVIFFVFFGLFTALILRVLYLPDELFVNSLNAVGGFFRDTSLAAFLVHLIRAHVPEQAIDTLHSWNRSPRRSRNRHDSHSQY